MYLGGHGGAVVGYKVCRECNLMINSTYKSMADWFPKLARTACILARTVGQTWQNLLPTVRARLILQSALSRVIHQTVEQRDTVGERSGRTSVRAGRTT